MFHFRPGKWRLLRITRDQVGWDRVKHCPKFKYSVTLTNGAFISYGTSKWLLLAIYRAWIDRKGFSS
jgi:hypothetical protein